MDDEWIKDDEFWQWFRGWMAYKPLMNRDDRKIVDCIKDVHRRWLAEQSGTDE